MPSKPLPEGENVEIRLADPPSEVSEELRAELEAWDHASASALDLVERSARANGEKRPSILPVEIQLGSLSVHSRGRNNSRLQLQLRTMLIAVPALGVGLAVLTVILSGCDAFTHGPYVTWYNQRCRKLADDAKLVGRPEKDVVKILGPPTFFYPGDDDTKRTYNYVPTPMFPTAKFQVHCHNGVVTAVEQFDD
jgi:hypothetical protein